MSFNFQVKVKKGLRLQPAHNLVDLSSAELVHQLNKDSQCLSVTFLVSMDSGESVQLK